jgi:hypothetical protein
MRKKSKDDESSSEGSDQDEPEVVTAPDPEKEFENRYPPHLTPKLREMRVPLLRKIRLDENHVSAGAIDLPIHNSILPTLSCLGHSDIGNFHLGFDIKHGPQVPTLFQHLGQKQNYCQLYNHL